MDKVLAFTTTYGTRNYLSTLVPDARATSGCWFDWLVVLGGPSPDLLSTATTLLNDPSHTGIQFLKAFPEKSIDWIFCCQALEHSTDIPKAIAEACRVARVGLYYSVPLEYDTEKNRTQNPSRHLFEPNPIKWLDFWLPHPDWTLYTVGRINRGFYLLLCLLAADLKPASNGE